jgi:hypothetical protein
VDDSFFWSLIDDTRSVSDGSPERHASALRRRLSALPAGQILGFERRWREHDRDAYRWELWAAGYLLNGGCDEACFEHFRSYVIGLGRDVYRAAIRDADSLVFLAEGPRHQFAYDATGLSFAAMDAYAERTGDEMPAIGPELPEEPFGQEWDEATPELVVPKIAAAVGWIETDR